MKLQTRTLPVIDHAGTSFYPAQSTWSEEPPFTPAREGWIDADGAKLWYQDSGGAGIPIVLLHAATGSAASWRYQQAPLSEAGFRVIAYSRRGHYRSTVQPDAGEISGAEDLLQLASQLALPPFHLLAVAAGGFTAMDFALSHPGRLRSLVMASSLGGIQAPEFAQAVERLLVAEVRSLPAHIRELGPSYRALNPHGVARWIELQRLAAQGSHAMPATDNRIDWESLRGLQVPTLFLTGDADLYMPPALFSLLRPHLPDARYVVIAEAGHASAWEQPDAFNAAVLSFVARH